MTNCVLSPLPAMMCQTSPRAAAQMNIALALVDCPVEACCSLRADNVFCHGGLETNMGVTKPSKS